MKYPPKGYDFVEGVMGTYHFYVNGKLAFTGSMLETVKFMVTKAHIKEKEILDAMKDLSDNGMDRAHFGSHGNFIGATTDPIGEVFSA